MLMLPMLRALLPSWRFFENFAEPLTLYYRTSINSVDFTDWQTLSIKNKRTIGNLFINADGNLKLANNSILEHLAYEIEQTPSEQVSSVFQSTPYKLIKNLVQFNLNQNSKSPTLKKFQFKINLSQQELLISELHDV